MSTIHLTSENFDEVIATGRVLVDFWADWCRPCKMLGPVIDEIAQDMEGKAKICKLDAENNKAIANRFKIVSIPTVIIFNDGVEIARHSGIKEKDEYIADLT